MSDTRSDDIETADAPGRKTYEDGPFAVKWMAGVDKELIAKAAKRAKKTTGEWLGEAARAYVETERQDDAFEVLAPGQEESRAMTVIDHPGQPLTVAELDAALTLGERIAAIQGTKLSPKGKLVIATKKRLIGRVMG